MKTEPISFAIGIPTINQWEKLQEYLQMYLVHFPKTQIFILDNGKQNCFFPGPGSENLTIIHEDGNIGVAASWNKLCRHIYAASHTHAMICNDDVYPGHSADYILSILEKYPRDLYKSSRDDMSVFILPKITFTRIGGFNTAFFPAYFEDRDYLRRLKLAGCSIMESIKFDPMIYKESQSSKKEPRLLDRFDFNERLYIDMWGGKPGFEKYDQPFNGSKRTAP
jgi:GT2 family glycosyltransferase